MSTHTPGDKLMSRDLKNATAWLDNRILQYEDVVNTLKRYREFEDTISAASHLEWAVNHLTNNVAQNNNIPEAMRIYAELRRGTGEEL